MSLQFTYGSRVVLLPAAVIEHIEKATKSDIRILMIISGKTIR